MPPNLPSRKRLWWLLGGLAIVLTVAISQHSFLAKFPLGQSYRCLREQNVGGALWWHSLAKRLAPHAAEIEFVEARIWRHQVEFDKARQCLAQARDRGFSAERISLEEHLIGVQEGEIRAQEQHLAELLDKQRGDELEISDAYVASLTDLGNYVVALMLLSSWEKDYPRDPQPHFRRAVMLQEQRRWTEAEEHLVQALKLNPRHGPSALLLGELLLVDNRPSQARSYFERAQSDLVRHFPARLGLAKSYLAMGEQAAAQKLLNELLAERPADRGAAVAMSQIEMSQGDYRAALERLDPLVARQPHDFDLRYAHATALRGVGRLEEAKIEFEVFAASRAALDRAVKLKSRLEDRPDDPALRFEIGQLCLQGGLEKSGLRWLHTVFSYDPQHAPTHRFLADYYSEHQSENPEYAALSRRHAEMAGQGTP